MKTDKPCVSVVIINWKGWQDTRQCVESLMASIYPRFDLILVDNESEDAGLRSFVGWAGDIFDSIALLPKDGSQWISQEPGKRGSKIQYPTRRLFIFALSENTGFAAGCNRAVKYAQLQGARFVFLLNNDTVVEPDTLETLVAFALGHSAFPVLTPQIRYYDEPGKIWNCGGKLLWPGIRKYYFKDKNRRLAPVSGHKKVSFVTGCALFYDARQVGLLSERFFFGEEDFELSLRLKRKKMAMACVYQAVVFHKVSESIGKSHSRLLNRIHLHYLNRLVNLRNFNPPVIWFFMVCLQLTYMVPMVRIKHGFPLGKILAMTRSLIRDIRMLKRVDKATFDRIGKEIY